ncbi:DUF427 domain-containing protein [Nocardia macrotermitis]|uniref:DUF427 domain-containing protein n=1 Tax=Nocardia macrotermitis TaxID=2585198 RepID=A0A7K0CVV8_9NOCA|nr:DUF427 domain-containing protein [Nocardia macrotermitis]MQY17636.1 hypothetical protein [Nocardia macrotermitis]
MTTAIWNGQQLAASDATIVVEGNHYFPPDSIDRQFFEPTGTHSTCSWKGEASYYTVTVEGTRNVDAAWYYPEPLAEAENIKDYVAFWRGVEVREG